MIRRHVVGRRSLLLGAASIGALAASSARVIRGAYVLSMDATVGEFARVSKHGSCARVVPSCHALYTIAAVARAAGPTARRCSSSPGHGEGGPRAAGADRIWPPKIAS